MADMEAASPTSPCLRSIMKMVLVEVWSTGKRRAEDQKVMAKLREKYLSEYRLLLFSVCVDLDFGDWIDHVNSGGERTCRRVAMRAGDGIAAVRLLNDRPRR